MLRSLKRKLINWGIAGVGLYLIAVYGVPALNPPITWESALVFLGTWLVFSIGVGTYWNTAAFEAELDAEQIEGYQNELH